MFPPEIAPYIDIGAYLLDARAPAATLFFDGMLKGKELIIINRADQADPKTTKLWRQFFQAKGYPCIPVDSTKGDGMDKVLDYLAQLLKRKTAVAESRGIMTATLRIAALGVPNVGKSTFLNKLIKRKRMKTGNRPGITRGRQWVRLFADVEVLDTPGILRDPVGFKQRRPYWMLLNLMPYDHQIREKMIELLISCLGEKGLAKLYKFYKSKNNPGFNPDWLELLKVIGWSRNFMVEDDDGVDRASRTLMKDFQLCRFGRHTLQHPDTAVITSPLFRGNEQARE